MTKRFATFILLAFCNFANGQTSESFAESLRIKYKIPELAFAVVSADSIFDLQVIGVQRANTNYKAKQNTTGFKLDQTQKQLLLLLQHCLLTMEKLNGTQNFLTYFQN